MLCPISVWNVRVNKETLVGSAPTFPGSVLWSLPFRSLTRYAFAGFSVYDRLPLHFQRETGRPEIVDRTPAQVPLPPEGRLTPNGIHATDSTPETYHLLPVGFRCVR